MIKIITTLLMWKLIKAQTNCLLTQYSNNNTCFDCATPCQTCTSEIDCVTCSQGYYGANNSCIKCPNYCVDCTSLNLCIQCVTGMSSINGQCLGTRITTNSDEKSLQFQNVNVKYQSSQVLFNGLNESFLKINVSIEKNFVQNNINSINQQLQITPQSVGSSQQQQMPQQTYVWVALGVYTGDHHSEDLILLESDGTVITVNDGQIFSNLTQIGQDTFFGLHNDIYLMNKTADDKNLYIGFLRPYTPQDIIDSKLTEDSIVMVDWAMGVGQVLSSRKYYYHGMQRGSTIMTLGKATYVNKTCPYNCIKCKDGLCITCASGYFNEKGQCTECFPSCKECNGETSSSCTKCFELGQPIYLIQGQCMTQQYVDQQLTQSQGNLLLYANQFGVRYQLQSNPYHKCPEYECTNGYCVNGYCQCVQGAQGYQCEVSSKFIEKLQPKIKQIVNRIVSAKDQSLEMSAVLMQYITQVSYGFDKKTQSQLIANTEYIFLKAQKTEKTLIIMKNLFQSSLNLFQHQAALFDGSKKIRSLMTQIGDQMVSIISKGDLKSSHTQAVFGFLYVGQLSVKASDQQVEQNLVALRQRVKEPSYVRMLMLYNDTTIVIPEVRNYSSVQFDIAIFDMNGSRVKFPKNVTFNLNKIVIPSVNETQLLCVEFININNTVQNFKPIIKEDQYTCQVSSGRFFVGQKEVQIIDETTDPNRWTTADNYGFYIILVLDLLAATLFGLLYAYEKYWEKMVADYQSAEAGEPNEDKQHMKEEQMYQVHDDVVRGVMISPMQTGNRQNEQQLIEVNLVPVDHPIDPKQDIGSPVEESFMDASNNEFDEGEHRVRHLNKSEPDDRDAVVPVLVNIDQIVVKNLDADLARQETPKEEDNKKASQTQPHTLQKNVQNLNSIVLPDLMRASHETLRPNILVNSIHQPDQVREKEGSNEEARQQTEIRKVADPDEDESEISDLDLNSHYDLWNLHPLVCIARTIRHHRKLVWQSYFLSVFIFQLHLYLLLLTVIYDIYVSVQGTPQDVPEFMGYTFLAILFSWPINYLVGFLSIFLKGKDESIQDDHETNETLLLLYWPIWVAVILFFDIIISWRAFYYKNGVSDYWMASAFFCPVLDLIIFDPSFILIVSFVLQRKKHLEEKVINFIKIRGFFQPDMFLKFRHHSHQK